MKKDEEIRIIKVPLEVLLNQLADLYNSGVNYVDIGGKNMKDENQDAITIHVREDYYEKIPERTITKDEYKDFLTDLI